MNSLHQQKMAKLVAIDGFNIVRRIYEANPESDSPEKAEVVIRISLSAFQKLHREHAPTHSVVVFDFGGKTWRHALYEKYREQRAPMPDALRQCVPMLISELEKFNMKVLCIPEVEADDVIGTVVLRWLAEGRGAAVVVSTDKDLHVLIAQGAVVWDHFKNEWHDGSWVQKKFGVGPGQLADLLALTGDPTDGIPGVTKIGMKTAAKLLQTYGTIDAIMAGAGILKNTVGENLRKDAKILALSRQLVALKSDVQLGVSWKMLAAPNVN